MGTHPIFESDFDCLTEKNQTKNVGSKGCRLLSANSSQSNVAFGSAKCDKSDKRIGLEISGEVVVRVCRWSCSHRVSGRCHSSNREWLVNDDLGFDSRYKKTAKRSRMAARVRSVQNISRVRRSPRRHDAEWVQVHLSHGVGPSQRRSHRWWLVPGAFYLGCFFGNLLLFLDALKTEIKP